VLPTKKPDTICPVEGSRRLRLGSRRFAFGWAMTISFLTTRLLKLARWVLEICRVLRFMQRMVVYSMRPARSTLLSPLLAAWVLLRASKLSSAQLILGRHRSFLHISTRAPPFE
jgi:hypothetical protein